MAKFISFSGNARNKVFDQPRLWPIWIQMDCGADLNSWLSLVSHALSHSMEILSYEVTISMGSKVVFRLEWPEV